MNKTIKILLAIAIVGSTFTACKTKQKVTKIPGANVEAKAPEATTPATQSTPTQASTPEYSGPEVTRNEKFSLAEGETNADALRYKYHVVVGSFKNKDNARGLVSTLRGEGNNALMVVNEQGMFRVLIASFDNYAQARSRINQINSRFPDAWVLVQK